MKIVERKKARALRKTGMSLQEIALQLKVAKSSVSIWVRDVKLQQSQKGVLVKRPHTRDAVEKRRSARVQHEQQRRQITIDQAAMEIGLLSRENLFILGIGLYWAEGAKTRRSIVQFTNSDPRLIEIMMAFFNQCCGVPSLKYRAHIHLHEHLNCDKAVVYWSSVSGIPKKQFFKTTVQHKRKEGQQKDTLPFGTFSIYICDTKLHLTILGWMQGLHRQTNVFRKHDE